ncbi:MAG TPA: hypothetical protein VF462_06965 [Micromonosporaceae bacterium]
MGAILALRDRSVRSIAAPARVRIVQAIWANVSATGAPPEACSTPVANAPSSSTPMLRPILRCPSIVHGSDYDDIRRIAGPGDAPA